MSAPGVPQSVSKWTPDTVRRIVAEHPHEPDWLDYKEALVPHRSLSPENKAKHKESIRRCACAMANSLDGFILFGVSDKRDAEDRLVGIDLTQDLRKQFGDLLGAIDPNIRGFDAKAIPFDGGDEGIWVVQVPLSPLRPHILNGKFYKRTAGGTCEPMTASEVRDQMMLRETQLKKLELLALAFEQMKQTFDSMNYAGKPHETAERLDTDSFRLLIGETASLLSPELLKNLLLACTLGDVMNRRFDWAQQAYVLGQVTGREDFYVSTHSKDRTVLANTLSICKRPLEELVASYLGKNE